jgi:hypothetical protein
VLHAGSATRSSDGPAPLTGPWLEAHPNGFVKAVVDVDPVGFDAELGKGVLGVMRSWPSVETRA